MGVDKLTESREAILSRLREIVDLGNGIMNYLEDGPVPLSSDGVMYRGLGSEGQDIKGFADSFEAKIRGREGLFYEVQFRKQPYSPDND